MTHPRMFPSFQASKITSGGLQNSALRYIYIYQIVTVVYRIRGELNKSG